MKTAFHLNLSENDISGKVISIDPSIGHIGWAIHEVKTYDKTTELELLDYGTLLSNSSDMVAVHSNMKKLTELLNKHTPDYMIIEDYVYIPGRTKGMFVVPGMIMLIKNEWYKFSKTEAFIVPSTVWKKTVIGTGSADKQMIRDTLKTILDQSIVNDIEKTYKTIRNCKKSDSGEQDCYDAIGIGMYFCYELLQNKRLNQIF